MGRDVSGRKTPAEIVQRAERLLRHQAQAAVAAALGLDDETVRAIARGRHPTQRARARLSRCPTCGGLVAAPCELCRVRRWKGIL